MDLVENREVLRNMVQSNIVALINDPGNTNNGQSINKKTRQKSTKIDAFSTKFFLTQLTEKDDDLSEPRKNLNKDLKNSVYKNGMKMELKSHLLDQCVIEEVRLRNELFKKRMEFEKRINVCKEKQMELAILQEQDKEAKKKYQSFINEKESIRKKAIAKYQFELKSRLQKMVEHDLLVNEFKDVKLMHQNHTKKVEKNKKFKDFLTMVINLLPDNYLEAGESKYASLIMRHQTLFESNVDLFENLIANSDKLKALRNEFERINVEHNSNKMTVNSKLGELVQIREQLNLKNSRFEENLNRNGEKMRQNVLYMFFFFNLVLDVCFLYLY